MPVTCKRLAQTWDSFSTGVGLALRIMRVSWRVLGPDVHIAQHQLFRRLISESEKWARHVVWVQCRARAAGYLGLSPATYSLATFTPCS